MAIVKPETNTQKVLPVVLLVSGFFLALFLAILTIAVFNWSDSLAPARSIVVSGEGRAVLAPDIANVTLSVVSEGQDPTILQNDNNEKINKAVDFLKGLGVDAKDIKTTGYNLSPKYEYDEKKRKSFIDGYNLTQTVSVKIRDLSKVPDVLSGLPGLGINQMSGPNFAVDDIQKHLQEARAAAFKNAWEKARQLADLNGVRLGRVMTFSEEGGGMPPPIYFAKEMAVGGAPVRPDIEPGSEEASVRVNITFELK